MKDVYYKCDKETIRKFVEIYEKYFPTIPAYVPTGRGLNQGASPLHLAVYAGDFRAVRFVSLEYISHWITSSVHLNFREHLRFFEQLAHQMGA